MRTLNKIGFWRLLLEIRCNRSSTGNARFEYGNFRIASSSATSLQSTDSVLLVGHVARCLDSAVSNEPEELAIPSSSEHLTAGRFDASYHTYVPPIIRPPRPAIRRLRICHSFCVCGVNLSNNPLRVFLTQTSVRVCSSFFLSFLFLPFRSQVQTDRVLVHVPGRSPAFPMRPGTICASLNDVAPAWQLHWN